MGIIIRRKDGEMVVLPCCGFKIPPREAVPQDQDQEQKEDEMLVVGAIEFQPCGYYATVNGSYRLYKNAKGEFRLVYQYQIFSCSDRKNRIMLKDENRDVRMISDVDTLLGKELMCCLYEDLKYYLESEGYNILTDC